VKSEISDKKKLTTTNGALVADNQNVLTAGSRRPLFMQDVGFMETLTHFDSEVIPVSRP